MSISPLSGNFSVNGSTAVFPTTTTYTATATGSGGSATGPGGLLYVSTANGVMKRMITP